MTQLLGGIRCDSCKLTHTQCCTQFCSKLFFLTLNFLPSLYRHHYLKYRVHYLNINLIIRENAIIIVLWSLDRYQAEMKCLISLSTAQHNKYKSQS